MWRILHIFYVSKVVQPILSNINPAFSYLKLLWKGISLQQRNQENISITRHLSNYIIYYNKSVGLPVNVIQFSDNSQLCRNNVRQLATYIKNVTIFSCVISIIYTKILFHRKMKLVSTWITGCLQQKNLPLYIVEKIVSKFQNGLREG